MESAKTPEVRESTSFIIEPINSLLACDIGVALPDATQAGYTILGKNSDRPIFDSQCLEFHPRQKFEAGEMLHLEYVSIPQVEGIYTTLGSRPYWCWGYEEGGSE